MSVMVEATKTIAHFSELEIGLGGGFAEDVLVGTLADQINESQIRVPKDTEELHDSIEGSVSKTANVVSGLYEVGADYGIYIEFETEPHFVPEQYIGDWAVSHGFERGGLFVSGREQPFVRRHGGETILDVAERMGEQTVKGIEQKIKDIF